MTSPGQAGQSHGCQSDGTGHGSNSGRYPEKKNKWNV